MFEPQLEHAMTVIESFIKQYNKEYDFYQKVAQIVYGRIEDELFKRGIKAIVSSRAKKPDRLKEKLQKRNETKKYKSHDDIIKDIVDLAGVRVSLYFPSERDLIDQLINEIFIVELTKTFPENQHEPKLGKRFSGYWATHYRVKLKEEQSFKRYNEVLCEVQVASVLMHAWSEVEHDLVYKPFSGSLSKEEISILDEINGLVMSGEIALERLQAAMAARTGRADEITNRYELTNFLVNVLAENEGKLKLGDTNLLNVLMNSNKKLNTKTLNNLISNINFNSNETFTEQLLEMLILSSDTNKKNYFRSFQLSESTVSGFESFIKTWIVLEKAVNEILAEENIQPNRHVIPTFSILETKGILASTEAQQLHGFRKIRNQIMHGVGETTDAELKSNFKTLKQLTAKVIQAIKQKSTRDELRKELDSIK